jgi:thiamine-phosphate pyrophosphorylase
MKIVLISNPTNIPKEHELINALFENGMDYFHVRKPELTEEEMVAYIKNIKPFYLRRISIHAHFKLIEKYNIGGVHLPEKLRTNFSVKEILKAASKKGIRITTSIHECSNLSGLKGFDYVFVSPIFDSISKLNYKGIGSNNLKSLITQLRATTTSPVVGLGGIDQHNISQLTEFDLNGIALMGAVWKSFEIDQDIQRSVQRFLEIKSEALKLAKA